jgi:nucleotide-binding universal stress UspA family protein
MPEWSKQQQALGSADDVQRFVYSACARLNAPLESARNNHFRFLPQHLPEALRLRLDDEGIDKPLNLDFTQFHRSHPLVTVLAEHLLEEALQGASPIAARCAATITADVEIVTTLYLLRLRHQLSYVRRRQPHQLMAEETLTLAVQGRSRPQWLSDEDSSALLQCEPSANLPVEQVQREVRTALGFLQAHPEHLEVLATQRAEALLADHRRVREAARDVGQYSVTPCLPVDVIGVYVLLPDAL